MAGEPSDRVAVTFQNRAEGRICFLIFGAHEFQRTDRHVVAFDLIVAEDRYGHAGRLRLLDGLVRLGTRRIHDAEQAQQRQILDGIEEIAALAQRHVDEHACRLGGGPDVRRHGGRRHP